MKTEILSGEAGIIHAAELIQSGKLVSVPTETVYGLCCNGLDAQSVEEIYEVKGRPECKPLSLMVADSSSFSALCKDVPPQAHLLAQKYWPGPLTIVLNSLEVVPEIVRAGGKTVGLRCPAHTATLELLKKCALPLAGPSANPSGEPSPKCADDVFRYFEGKISGILDGGICSVGKESTIIDLSAVPFRILRSGALDSDDIWNTLRENMTIIGITGGSGCGKTTALRVLEDYGALLLDCDQIYHSLTENSMEMREALTKAFGDVYNGNVLERKKLGAIVFSDPEKLQLLNNITHRFVRSEVKRLLNEHAQHGGTIAAIDAIALFEGELVHECDITIAVTANRGTQIERIMKRDGISREYAESRVNAQHDAAYFKSKCDYVLENNGTEVEFQTLCRNTFQTIIHNS